MIRSIFWAAAVAVVCFSSGAGSASAEQRYRIAFNVSAEETRYPQQLAMEVGDTPNHQVRIYELHRIHARDSAAFRGVKVIESWARGVSDYTDYSGPTSGYIVYVLENGERVFARYSGTVHSTSQPDGARDYVYHGVTTITGGTGSFRTVRGLLRDITRGTSQGGKALRNEVTSEGEYWFVE
jgi:hypothetical protein